jgi:hypothetical protein
MISVALSYGEDKEPPINQSSKVKGQRSEVKRQKVKGKDALKVSVLLTSDH